MKNRWVAALSSCVAVGWGCSEPPPDALPAVEVVRSPATRDPDPVVSAPDRMALADGNAAFAMALYREVEAGNPNLVFSPTSVTTALVMAFAGAGGETERQMASALRFTLPQDQLHPAMNQLTAALAARGEGTTGADGRAFRLRILNTIWSRSEAGLGPEFLEVLARDYGAGINLVDFAADPERARQTINGWVSDHSEQRVRELLRRGAITPATQLVLTNVVYFNAAWKNPFVEKTENRAFTRADGSIVQVPTMRQVQQLRAGVLGGRAAAVVLPYQDERLSMLVVLPDAGTLSAVEGELLANGLGPIDAALVPQRVSLSVPRFSFETAFDLNETLATLGMPIAFNSQLADFSGISPGLFISAVRHKATITVGENGTEAAAATAVVFGGPGAAVEPPLTITLNRPFLFFVRDEDSGAILFAGRVSDPAASTQ